MHEIAINWLALLVAALARMILGAVWYSPPVLLKPWLAAAGISEAEMKARFPKALIAVTSFSAMLYEHRPFTLWLIGNGYQLIALLIMGAILAVWP
jgi:hypothetical protein